MQNSHQEWKTHHLSQGNSSCKEKRNSHFQTWKMRKTWIHVHLHQGALLQTGTLCSAHSHTQGEFHRASNNWRWKIPTWWYFHASITILRQPHTWKLPRMYTIRKHYPTISKWTLTRMLTWTLTIRHTNTDIQRKKSTFFQNHQNSDH